MKLIPYEESLAMGPYKKRKALAGVRAQRAKKQAELAKAELEESLAVRKADLIELTSKDEIDFELLIDSLDYVELTKRRINQFDKVIEMLFPEKE